MVDLDVILPSCLSACPVFSPFHNKDPITHPFLPISHLENKALPFLRSEGKDNGSSGCGSQREGSEGLSPAALSVQEVGVGVRRGETLGCGDRCLPSGRPSTFCGVGEQAEEGGYLIIATV